MPIYEYACPLCGDFEAWRPADLAGEPVACPACGARSERRFGPPNIVRTPAALARARERSERSAYEPEVVTSPPRGGVPLHRARADRHKRPWQLG